MFNNVIEYQKQYFKCLYNVTKFEGGYLTSSEDLEYINANSIIGVEATSDLVASICILLAADIHTCRVQLPASIVPFDEDMDCLYLVNYEHQNLNCIPKIEIIEVTDQNFEQFKTLSYTLQCQEYGKEYKKITNDNLLQQNKYCQFMIKYNDVLVGEFIYIPQLSSLESLIIDKKFQGKKIGTAVLEQMSKQTSIYLSADNSSIGFYKKINSRILDETSIVNLYGNSRNLIMYLSLI